MVTRACSALSHPQADSSRTFLHLSEPVSARQSLQFHQTSRNICSTPQLETLSHIPTHKITSVRISGRKFCNEFFFFFNIFSAVNSRKRPSGTSLDLLSVRRKKNWLILKLNVGICCYSKPGPWIHLSAMLSAQPPVCCKWRQAVVKWEMQNSQSVCLFNVTGNISC